MSLRDTILKDVTDAMKSGDKVRVGTLRLVKAEIQNREVDVRAEKGADYRLGDDEVTAVLTRAAKQRRESVESFRAGGREDLAVREEQELAIVEAYLPRQLSEDDVRELIAAAIAETGATSPRDIGAVMKVLMPQVKGRADGKSVNRLVKERLG